ncbi:MAG: hypothetical protein Q8Q49_01285 [bacterium]|nr:hypothetical protein [bacterium]
MKDIFAIILVILLLGASTALTLAAETATPSPSPKKSLPGDSLTKEITNLKEKIASRVAELKLVEKRGIVGIVTEVKDTEITLSDSKGNTRFVDVDELTKFTGSDSKATFGISDIKKDMSLAILGRYNKQSERLLARFVKQITLPKFLSGTITDIDKTGFSFSLKDASGKTIDIDVENVTKTQSYTKENGVVRSGFSKLFVGDSVVLSGFPDKKDPTRIVATRVLLLSDFTKKTEIESSPPTTRPSAKPTATEQ